MQIGTAEERYDVTPGRQIRDARKKPWLLPRGKSAKDDTFTSEARKPKISMIIGRFEGGPTLAFLYRHGHHWGLRINLRKTKAWWRTKPGVALIYRRSIFPGKSISVQGSFIGHGISTRYYVSTRARAHENILQAMSCLRDPQLPYHRLQFCAGACRLYYFVRMTPPRLINAVAELFDSLQRRTSNDFIVL